MLLCEDLLLCIDSFQNRRLFIADFLLHLSIEAQGFSVELIFTTRKVPDLVLHLVQLVEVLDGELVEDLF